MDSIALPSPNSCGQPPPLQGPVTQVLQHGVSARARLIERSTSVAMNARLSPNMVHDDPHTPQSDGPPEGGPPPWINPAIQQQMKWRDGDIVVSVPLKSGTTWTMNIVHQLREGGDRNFADVYTEVPWIEFVPGPAATVEGLVAKIDGMPHARRRAFKSHAAPPELPFHAPGSGTDVKYVTVARNPEEALVSAYPFLANHSDEWFDLWQVPKAALVKPDFNSFYHEVLHPGFVAMIFGFMAQWWPKRQAANVLMLHFSAMKRDHEGSVRKIAEFLGFNPTSEQWTTILETTSFAWMKAHEDKFDAITGTDVRVLKPGGMIRKGKVGAAKDDGMTPDIAAKIASTGREMLRDPAAFEWLYSGGPLSR